MEIIKPGNIVKNNTIEFTCENCGCVFKASDNEYKRKYCSWNKYTYYITSCSCPYCGENVISRVEQKTNIGAYRMSEMERIRNGYGLSKLKENDK